MDDTVKDRLLHFIKYKGLSKNRFEETCGFSKRYVSNISQSIQPDKIKKISLNFPELNVGWLLTGEGEMLKKAHDVRPDQTFPLGTDRFMSEQDIPLYELAATAGLVSIFNDLRQEPVDHLRVPNLPPVDGAVYVRGDSMSPLLKSGDIIIFKKVELDLDLILWGQIYILSYSTGGDTFTVVKYVKRSSREGFIQLVSANTFYDPMEIQAASVTALALVKASITFYTME